VWLACSNSSMHHQSVGTDFVSFNPLLCLSEFCSCSSRGFLQDVHYRSARRLPFSLWQCSITTFFQVILFLLDYRQFVCSFFVTSIPSVPLSPLIRVCRPVACASSPLAEMHPFNRRTLASTTTLLTTPKSSSFVSHGSESQLNFLCEVCLFQYLYRSQVGGRGNCKCHVYFASV